MSRPLFDALDEIGAQVARAPHVLIVLNFDGTLNPIQPDPRTVYLAQPMAETLRALASHERVSMALISGRERADLQARALVPGLIYIGNHGLEISGPGLLFVEPAALASRPAQQVLFAEFKNRMQAVPSVIVEDKGLTLSVHYRMAPPETHETIRQQVHAALANSSHPFQLTQGDMVYEIRPRGTWNKASAISWLQEKLAKPGLLTIYAGDSPTDEEAFTALPEVITIRVGPGTETVAKYTVAGPGEVARFLAWLDGLLKPAPGPEVIVAAR